MFSSSWLSTLTLLTSTTTLVQGLKYTVSEAAYNLNANTTATNPLDYWIEERTNHTYQSSPKNWRFPFYTLLLDRFVNGDATNDNANNTLFEQDMTSTQIRFGGDLQGLVDSLDYIAGMGVKVILLCYLEKLWEGNVRDSDKAAKTIGHLPCWISIRQSALGCGFIFGKSRLSYMFFSGFRGLFD